MAAKRPPSRSLPGEAGGNLPGASAGEHEAPALPPGAPLPQQQGPALSPGEDGVLVEGDDVDDLFVSCVPSKGVVTRFGATGSAFIGARRDAKAESGVLYFPEAVLKIPGFDVRRFSREYGRVLAEGALVRRSRADYVAYRVKRDEALKASKLARETERAEVLKRATEQQAAAAQGSEPNQTPPATDSTGG